MRKAARGRKRWVWTRKNRSCRPPESLAQDAATGIPKTARDIYRRAPDGNPPPPRVVSLANLGDLRYDSIMSDSPSPERKSSLRLITAQADKIRLKLDPKVLERAKCVVEGGEIYDKTAAQKVIAEFLKSKSRRDGGMFQQELQARLRGVRH